MSQPVYCPQCRKGLKVTETEVETGGFIRPTVFSCAYCGHFLGISPYVYDAESEVSDIHSEVAGLHKALSELKQAVDELHAAFSLKRAKKSK